jgi:hypothetical protein
VSQSLPGVPPELRLRAIQAIGISLSLADSVQADFGPPSPVVLAVPEVNTLDYAALAWQIDDTRFSAVRDASAYWNLFLRAVSVPDDDALKIDRAATDAQLDGSKTSIRPAYLDAVMVHCAIHVGVPQECPASSLDIYG